MGLGDFFKKIKEENRNFGTTTKRINNRISLYGKVNVGVKDGDFWNGSYLSIEDGNGVIYGSAQDDYVFSQSDVTTFKVKNPLIKVDNGAEGCFSGKGTLFEIGFDDGKTALISMYVERIEAFRIWLGR